jgi:cysteine synthase A
VPENYDAKVVSQVVQVSSQEAFDMARQLTQYEGLLVGISSGASVCAALRLAALPDAIGKTVVVILPDTGERYLSVF